MRWRSALISKVIGRLYQTLSEMMMPEAVYNHPRQELAGSIFNIRQPISQGCQLTLG